jgi:DNA-binding GntR family transcriptional regulator
MEMLVETVKSLRSVSALDKVCQFISDSIAKGSFVAGQRLPESDLAEQLGVGRNVIREAFARLQKEGILEVQRFRGALVRRLSFDDVQEFLVVHSALLSVAMWEAAIKVGANPLLRPRIKAIRESLRKSDPSSQPEHLDVFYGVCDEIMDIADNNYLSGILRSGNLVLFKKFIIECVPFAAENVAHTKELDVVLALVEQGDGDGAYEALRRWGKLERFQVSPESQAQSAF